MGATFDGIGRGGFAEVWAAVHHRDRWREVAVKLLNNSRDESVRAMFERETQVLAKLHSPHFVSLIDYGRTDRDVPYLTMSLLVGESLGQRIDRGPLALSMFYEVSLQLFRAVQSVHEQKLIHHDIKPDNIFLSGQGGGIHVSVLDVGLCGPAMPPNKGAPGTLGFVGREHLEALGTDERTDILALGLSLYEALAGRRRQPNLGREQHLETAERLRAFCQPPSLQTLTSLLPELPVRLCDVLAKAMAFDPKERYASIGAFRDAFIRASRPHEIETVGGLEGTSLRVADRPYRGLESFSARHEQLFFGRDDRTSAVLKATHAHPLVVVTGASGAGKSSLLHAGVMPNICLRGSGVQDGQRFTPRWLSFSPGVQPLFALRRQLRQNDLIEDELDEVVDAGYEPQATAVAIICRLRENSERLWIAVDQAEEFFTHAQAQQTRETAELLAALVNLDPTLCRILLSIRGDFYHRLGDLARLGQHVDTSVVLLSNPDADQLAETLLGPARAYGIRFEDGLVGVMIDEVIDTDAALPLLQFTADLLWDDCRDKDRKFTLARYEALGGVRGALARHADNVYTSLPSHRQRLARSMLTRLGVAEGTKTLVSSQDLTAIAESPHEGRLVLDTLTRSRLLTIRLGEGGDPTVELVHETLIQHWHRLADWLGDSPESQTNLETVAQLTRQWRANAMAKAHLWRGDALVYHHEWAKKTEAPLTDDEWSFLELSLTAGRNRTRLTVASLALVACALTFLWIRAESARLAAASAKTATEGALTLAQEATNEANRQRGLGDEHRQNAEKQRERADRLRVEAEQRAKEAQAARDEALEAQAATQAALVQIDALLEESRVAQKAAEAGQRRAESARVEAERALAAAERSRAEAQKAQQAADEQRRQAQRARRESDRAHRALESTHRIDRLRQSVPEAPVVAPSPSATGRSSEAPGRSDE